MSSTSTISMADSGEERDFTVELSDNGSSFKGTDDDIPGSDDDDEPIFSGTRLSYIHD